MEFKRDSAAAGACQASTVGFSLAGGPQALSVSDGGPSSSCTSNGESTTNRLSLVRAEAGKP